MKWGGFRLTDECDGFVEEVAEVFRKVVFDGDAQIPDVEVVTVLEMVWNVLCYVYNMADAVFAHALCITRVLSVAKEQLRQHLHRKLTALTKSVKM